MPCLLLCLALAQGPQRRNAQVTPPAAQTGSPQPAPAMALPDVPPVESQHEITVHGRTLRYLARAGMLPLKNGSGETEASVFFVSYTLEDAGDPAHRPLTFAFNGGPGSASLWLHLGAIGPRRVELLENGALPPPPYRLVDNEQTWLDQSDLVFIDPVGTGFSRAAKPEQARQYWSLQGDIQSIGEFVRLYLTRYERWSSPLFLAGESYGTTRAAGLSGWLVDQGIALNGVLLLSTVLNFRTISFGSGNDLPYVVFLPTYTATAWYHKKLSPDLSHDLRKTLAEVERWARTDYAAALAQGDNLPARERAAVAERLARYTGLSRQYVENSDLRVDQARFTKELLRDRRRAIGRYDSRLTGIESTAAGDVPEADPSYSAVRPPFTMLFNEYVRKDLRYKTDMPYYVLGEGINAPWDFGPTGRASTDVSAMLRSAFNKNPYMKLFVGMGYYDLATPYFSVKYTLDHLRLDPSLGPNLRTAMYEAGHMMYIDTPSRAKLREDVGEFYRTALSRGER